MESLLTLPGFESFAAAADDGAGHDGSPQPQPDGGAASSGSTMPGPLDADAAREGNQNTPEQQKELPRLLGMPNLQPAKAASLKASSLATLNALNMEIGEKALRMINDQYQKDLAAAPPKTQLSRLEEAVLCTKQSSVKTLHRTTVKERHGAVRPGEPPGPAEDLGMAQPAPGRPDEEPADAGPTLAEPPASEWKDVEEPADARSAPTEPPPAAEQPAGKERAPERPRLDWSSFPNGPPPWRRKGALAAASAAAAGAGDAEDKGSAAASRQPLPGPCGPTMCAEAFKLPAGAPLDLHSGTASAGSSAWGLSSSSASVLSRDVEGGRGVPAAHAVPGCTSSPSCLLQQGLSRAAEVTRAEEPSGSTSHAGTLERGSHGQDATRGACEARGQAWQQRPAFDDARGRRAARIINRRISRSGALIPDLGPSAGAPGSRNSTAAAAAGAETAGEANKAGGKEEVCSRATTREEVEVPVRSEQRAEFHPSKLDAVEPASTGTGSNPSIASSIVSTPQIGTPSGEPRTPPSRTDLSEHQEVMGQSITQEDALRSLSELVEGHSSHEAYRGPLSSTADVVAREEELRRLVQGLLNKACPENAARLARHLASDAAPQSGEELVLVIGLVTKKAVAEPQYADTYADLVCSLVSKIPAFPSASGGRPVTLKSALLNIVQSEYNSIPATMDGRQMGPEWLQQKARFIAIMHFIGKLFLRRLLPAKIIVAILEERLGRRRSSGPPPEEHVVECVCELLLAIGQALESMPVGGDALSRVCEWLRELAGQSRGDGGPVYSKRIRFVMQGVIDARAMGWAKNSFKEVAKTKEEVRLDQERELSARASRRYGPSA